ncbi:hypothetical protein [Wolbachia endosymbiont (group A) of Clivina fossor]|uniref:hypothetical protein n=1 Tax=Wolbachia endosymbiont (group A) of Clivina fossor TaxID=3066133 RepID=UPI0031330E78
MGRQIEYTINSLKPPVIGGKHSFSFVSLLLRIGINIVFRVKELPDSFHMEKNQCLQCCCRGRWWTAWYQQR